MSTKNLLLTITFALCTFAALIFVWSAIAPDVDAIRPQNGPSTATTCYMAQKFVTDALKAPTSAKFPAAREPDCKVGQRGRIWIVSSYVDSQNGFGAMIRSNYKVEMIFYPATGKWTLVDISVFSR